MKFLAGWIAGLATAWTALALWRRIPPFPDIDPEPDGDPDVSDGLDRRFDPPRPTVRTGHLIASGGGWRSPLGEYPFDPTGDVPEQDIIR